MLEGVGSLLQQAHAVCARLDGGDYGHQEDSALEYERLFEYYALLRGNITEARKANLMEANIALMEHPLPSREIEE